MRIVIVHNEYINRGGEDVVLDNEAALLRENGHDVVVAKVSNRDIHGVRARIKTALYTASSPFGAECMRKVLAESRPDNFCATVRAIKAMTIHPISGPKTLAEISGINSHPDTIPTTAGGNIFFKCRQTVNFRKL